MPATKESPTKKTRRSAFGATARIVTRLTDSSAQQLGSPSEPVVPPPLALGVGRCVGVEQGRVRHRGSAGDREPAVDRPQARRVGYEITVEQRQGAQTAREVQL